jgi:hypothetical protein
MDRPNHSLSGDSLFGIGINPTYGASKLSIGANVPHEFVAEVGHRGEYAARDDVPFDFAKQISTELSQNE